jgi:NRAMP (natural resistance-associated macrophage protein)-like metal ion transporter
LISGAADDDPSGIATYSMAGARFGTSLLWTALITWPLMAAVQTMCARIGMVTGRGITAAFKARFPKSVVFVAITALLLANTINVAADLSGMADAAEMLTHVSSHVWVIVFAVGISIVTIRLRYYQIAGTLKWLTLTLFAYVISAFVVQPDWSAALRDTLVPQLPKGKEGWQMLVAIFGTTISPYLFFWQATQEVEEEKAAGRKTLAQRKGATSRQLRIRRFDVGVGTFYSNMVMYFIILTAAATLHRAGHTNIETTAEAAVALRSLAGPLATTLYTLGLVGVGLLSIPTLTGAAAYAYADFLGWKRGLDRKLKQARSFYAIILASTTTAVFLDFMDVRPITALYWMAVINGMLAPFLLVGILTVASDAGIMEKQTSTKLARWVVAVTTAIMFFAGMMIFV